VGDYSFSALVLAGRRSGEKEPLAAVTGCSHKALLEVAGRPMLEHVLRSVAAQPGLCRLAISSDRSDLLQALPALSEMGLKIRVEHHCSAASPAASVADFIEASASAGPLLVTTADHALLTAQMLSHFWAEALSSGAEVAVGVVSETLFRASYPHLRRTFVRLGSQGFSGANLFALIDHKAASVARFWSSVERYRKRPVRLIGQFGLRNLLRYALGRFDADTAVSEVSRILGVRVALIQMPFAECAIDVDKPADLDLVADILSRR